MERCARIQKPKPKPWKDVKVMEAPWMYCGGYITGADGHSFLLISPDSCGDFFWANASLIQHAPELYQLALDLCKTVELGSSCPNDFQRRAIEICTRIRQEADKADK
jgi:hypothetical protein